MRQKKSAFYSDIKSNKYRVLCKDPSQLEAQLLREQDKMTRLVDLVTKVKMQFPNAALSLERVVCSYGFTFDDVRSNSY